MLEFICFFEVYNNSAGITGATLRQLLVGVFLLIWLSGCGYSAKSVITIQGDKQQLQAELDDYVKYLRRHRDGCFSERLAPMLVSGPLEQQRYLISVDGTAMDLALSLNSTGSAIRLELDEWSEKRFSPRVASCYQQLIKNLVSRFGASNIDVVEICQATSCR